MSPRNEEQNQLIRDERRDQILNHAFQVFAKKGFTASKISDVAQSAGLSQGLIYHYFKSKEEMFIAAVEQTVELSNKAMEAINKMPLGPCEKIKIITEKTIGYRDARENALRWFLMLQTGLSDSVPQQARELLGKKFAAMEYVCNIIKEGQEKGEFSSAQNADTLTTAYWSLIQGLVYFSALNSSNMGTPFCIPDSETICKILK